MLRHSATLPGISVELVYPTHICFVRYVCSNPRGDESIIEKRLLVSSEREPDIDVHHPVCGRNRLSKKLYVPVDVYSLYNPKASYIHPVHASI